MKARKLVDGAIKTLKTSDAIDHWQKGRERIEAEMLLGFVMGGEEPDPEDKISDEDAATYEAAIARRASGEPIPLITGYTEFRGLELKVVPGVFIPRDSTEFLAEQAIRRLRRRKAPVHLDLATGLGTVALSVADEVPGSSVYGTDLSTEATSLARRNAKRLGLDAHFVTGDLFAKIPTKLRGKVDVITMHPPYVAREEIQDLPDEIREWEPVHTLTDQSDDGLGLVRRTVEEAPAWLRSKGWLLMETDPDRAREVRRVFTQGGFRDVESTKGGELKVTRVVVGRRPR